MARKAHGKEVYQMRMIGVMADRMLNMVVPKFNAAACTPTTAYYYCGCEKVFGTYTYFIKPCTIQCNGTTTCGACEARGYDCTP
jgi:hypothetical protein